MQVFAFAKVPDPAARTAVYESISSGKSRFGQWGQSKSLREEWIGAHMQLLSVQAGDWIVHVNCPEYGKCTAVQSIGEYGFDEGIQCTWENDYSNFIPVDPTTRVEFDRRDPNVLPNVNLAPRRRIQRVHQVDDFLASIENLRSNRIREVGNELRGVVHLREKMSGEFLPKVVDQIHQMNRGKEFERFLQLVFESVPNCVSTMNGFGFGTDFGADLIVEFEVPVIGISAIHKIVVQAKSYEGVHDETKEVDQIIEGIRKYEADGGLLISTGNPSEKLEEYLREKSDEIGKTIDLLAGTDVARFVIRYAPELLIGNV